MRARASMAWFSSSGPSEWHDVDYLRPAARHWGIAPTLLLTFAIAVADISWPRTTLPVLYIVPLLLLAQLGEMRYLGRIVGLLLALTFSAYLIKKMIDPVGSTQSHFHYSLLNRTIVATMLIAVSYELRIWVRWREDQSSRELPEDLRQQDRDISTTLAVVLGAPLIVLIVLVDVFSPANYNLAILYLVPLLLCVWTRSRPLLWTTLAVLVVLAVIAQNAGPPATDTETVAVAAHFRNRLLAVCTMVCVTAILHFWIGKK